MTARTMRVALLRRSVRVLVFTVLLTAVGCCGGDNALSNCLGEITQDPCYLPHIMATGPHGESCGKVKVLFIKDGSGCTDCSVCPGSSYGMTLFEEGVTGGFGTACVGGCQQICGQTCAQ